LIKVVPLKQNAATVHRIPITKARINLGQVVRRVHLNREYFILEKDGIPVAGLMGADELEDYLELRDPKVRAQIRKSNADYLAGRSRPAADFIAELRAETQRKRGRRRTP
jgi:antitoxin (DNA-binding transcriptional repressor) of toxin-antitoxin stability system